MLARYLPRLWITFGGPHEALSPSNGSLLTPDRLRAADMPVRQRNAGRVGDGLSQVTWLAIFEWSGRPRIGLCGFKRAIEVLRRATLIMP
jgi:hypothetical protein